MATNPWAVVEELPDTPEPAAAPAANQWAVVGEEPEPAIQPVPDLPEEPRISAPPASAAGPSRRYTARTPPENLQTLETVTSAAPRFTRDATWGDVMTELPVTLGGRIEKKIVGAQEFGAQSAFTNAKKRLWQSIVLPEAARMRARGESPAADLEQAARHVGIRPDQFAMDWPEFASMSEEELEAVRQESLPILREQGYSLDELAQRRQTAERVMAQARPEMEPWSPKALTFDLATSAPDLALAAAAGMVGGPIAGIGVMGAELAPEIRSDALNAGLSPEEANTYTALMTGAEVLPELPVLQQMFHTPAAKQFVMRKLAPRLLAAGRQVGAGALSEAGSEAFTETLQQQIEREMLGKEMSFGDALSDIARAGVIGAGMGGPLGAHPAIKEFQQESAQQDAQRAEQSEADSFFEAMRSGAQSFAGAHTAPEPAAVQPQARAAAEQVEREAAQEITRAQQPERVAARSQVESQAEGILLALQQHAEEIERRAQAEIGTTVEQREHAQQLESQAAEDARRNALMADPYGRGEGKPSKAERKPRPPPAATMPPPASTGSPVPESGESGASAPVATPARASALPPVETPAATSPLTPTQAEVPSATPAPLAPAPTPAPHAVSVQPGATPAGGTTAPEWIANTATGGQHRATMDAGRAAQRERVDYRPGLERRDKKGRPSILRITTAGTVTSEPIQAGDDDTFTTTDAAVARELQEALLTVEDPHSTDAQWNIAKRHIDEAVKASGVTPPKKTFATSKVTRVSVDLDKREAQEYEQQALDAGQYTTIQRKDGKPVRLVNLQNERGQGLIVAFGEDRNFIGMLDYTTGKHQGEPQSHVSVSKPNWRQGIATAMYDLAEQTGGAVSRFEEGPRTPMGQAFREAREARKQEQAEGRAAAPRAAVPPPKGRPQHDSILEYMSKTRLHGASGLGISIDALAAEGLDPAELRAARGHGMYRPFTKGGAESLDQVAEHLAEAGYPVKDAKGNYDPTKLLDLITQELRQGKRTTAAARTFEDAEARAQQASDEFAQQQQAAKDQGLDDYSAVAANAAAADLKPGDSAQPKIDPALIFVASTWDEAATEAARQQHEDDKDTARLMAEIRRIIAAHEGHTGQPAVPGGEAVRPHQEAAGQHPGEAPAFALQSQAAATAQEVRPRAAQTDLFGKNQTAQDLADLQRKKDEARSPNRDVPAGAGGGLFSGETRQPELPMRPAAEPQPGLQPVLETASHNKEPAGEDELTGLDEDIGMRAAGGEFTPEAMEPEPTSKGTGRGGLVKPSTPRENLMDWLGIDATKLRLMGGEEQFKTIAKAIKDRYGFAQIVKAPSQTWRNASDHLLDAFESLQNMASALSMGPKVVSLDGRISLHFQRNTQARGLFYYRSPSGPDNNISIRNQSDVYAHEYGHALDYHLMELTGTQAPGGLSRMIRERQDTSALPSTINEAYVDLFNALYYDEARIAALIRKTEHELEKATAPSKIEKLQQRLENLRTGMWRGKGASSEFARRARTGPMRAYLAKPTEMIARSFEAYMSWKIQSQKELGLVKFLGQTDAIYSDTTDAWMNRIYPQDPERMRIFAAWDNVIGQIQRQQLYDTKGNPGFAESKVNLGLIDPVAQAKAEGLPITKEIVQAKNLSDAAAHTYLEDQIKRADSFSNNLRALAKGLTEEGPAAAQALQTLMRDVFSTPDGVFAWLEKRYPKNRALRIIRDNFSDAQIHGRDKPLGIYRELQRAEAALTNRLEDRLAAVGIHRNMPTEWASHMWDVMHGNAEPADGAEKRQADQLRYEYDYLWKLRDQSGERIGYTAEPYMNRMFHRQIADHPKFKADLLELRKQEQERLIELYTERVKNAKTPAQANAATAALKRTRAIDTQAATDAQIAAMKGVSWGPTLRVGSLNEDSAKERVFGPLADQVLKKWYVKDPFTLLAAYSHSAARGQVMRRRLGETPDKTISGWLTAAAKDLPQPFAELLEQSMKASLGLRDPKGGLGAPVATALQAYATVSQANALGRAVLPNVSEPLGIFSKTFTPLKTIADLGTALVPLLRSKNRSARYAAAKRFGRLAGVLVDAASSTTAQAQAIGEDTVGFGLLARFSMKAYMHNLMSPLTAAQEKAINHVGMEMFYDAAQSVREGDDNADVYSQWLREHGIRDVHGFSEWLQDHSVLDQLDFESTLSGHPLALANALEHLGKTTIQKPTPSTKLLLSRKGNFGLVFRLTSWMTTNYINWSKQLTARMKTAATGKYGDTKLSAQQRVNMMALPTLQALSYMYVAQAFFVVARMLLTHQDEWEERGEDFWDRFFSNKTQLQVAQYWGLLPWAVSAATDVLAGTRFHRGIFATLAGPVYGGMVQDGERFIAIGQKNRPGNTAEHNFMQAVYHNASMLATFGLLSALPTTKVWGRVVGFLWSFFGTSPWANKTFADKTVGARDDDEEGFEFLESEPDEEE